MGKKAQQTEATEKVESQAPVTETQGESQPQEVPQATCGRIVHYYPSADEKTGGYGGGANHAPKVPAIVTQAWGNHLANLRVFCDSNEVMCAMSVPHVSKAAEGQSCWDWPARD